MVFLVFRRGTGGGGGNPNGWWTELGRTKLGAASNVITVDPIAARKWLKILICLMPNDANPINMRMSFNNDKAGTNYCQRKSYNGAADGTSINLAQLTLHSVNSSNKQIAEVIVENQQTQEKQVIWHQTKETGAGAGAAPDRTEGVGKWVNTTAQITRIDVEENQTGSFAPDSEVIVLGHD